MQRYVQEVNQAGRQFIADMEQYQSSVRCVYGGGNFVLMQAKTEGIKEKLSRYLIQNDIYVRDLTQTEFLRKYCVRITIGTCAQMKKVVNAMGNFFREEADGKAGLI